MLFKGQRVIIVKGNLFILCGHYFWHKHLKSWQEHHDHQQDIFQFLQTWTIKKTIESLHVSPTAGRAKCSTCLNISDIHSLSWQVPRPFILNIMDENISSKIHKSKSFLRFMQCNKIHNTEFIQHIDLINTRDVQSPRDCSGFQISEGNKAPGLGSHSSRVNTRSTKHMRKTTSNLLTSAMKKLQ